MSLAQPLPEQEQTRCENPATGELLGYSPINTPDEALAIIAAARGAQRDWAALPLAERRRYVLRLRDYMVAHADALAQTVSSDVGKSRVDALTAEIVPSITATSYYARNARRFLKPRRLAASSVLFLNKRSTLYRVPIGVVAVVTPWNYPLSIPMHEIVPALLAGNSVIFRTAEETQLTGRAIEAMFTATEFPQGVFSYLNMPGPEASELFFAADGADKVFFTGSVPVGKQLMAQAAQTLTPVSLELGGNDAMLVCEDANLDRAVYGAMWAGLQNAGQTCAGVERMYVDEKIHDRFVALLAERVATLRVGHDLDFEVDVGAMCTARQALRVREQLDDALAKGATVVAEVALGPEHAEGNFLPLTVLTGVNHEMQVMREETFGPVLCVMPVRDMDHAVELANDSSLGLTASVWSRDTRKARQVARRIHAGAITINDHLVSHGLAETPWGGFGESGIGRSHGQFGFDEMTEPQVVINDLLHHARRNLWWHPHGESVYRGVRGAIDALYGKGLALRLTGLRRFASLIPRMFKD